jgi:hypothetical protein
VGAAAFRQGLLKNDFGDYFVYLVHITAAFFRQLEVFLELIGEINIPRGRATQYVVLIR